MSYYVHYMKDEKKENVQAFWRSRNKTLAGQQADYFRTMFGDRYIGYTKETK